jgi:S1-C subfamily serine protease
MTKSRHVFQWGAPLLVLLCSVSWSGTSFVLHADDAASARQNIDAASVRVDPLLMAGHLSQEIRSAVERIRPCVVTIRTTDDQSLHPPVPLLPEFSDDFSLYNSGNTLPSFLRLDSQRSTGGTGVIVSADGLIWTSRDVVQDCETVTVTLQNATTYEGRVVLNDSDSGLAIIKIDARNLPSVDPGLRTNPAIADWAVAVALNDHQEPIISAGLISSLTVGSSEYAARVKTIRFSFPVADDCRGCALINLKGEYLGLHVPTPSKGAGSTSPCIALDAASARAVQRKALKETPANGSSIEHSTPGTSDSNEARILGHVQNETVAPSLNSVRETLLQLPSKWTTDAFVSSVKNWLAPWQDKNGPQEGPASKASELRY